MPEAQSKRPARWRRQEAAVQRVKSSVLNDAHIDKWMAHPLLLLPPRLCLPPPLRARIRLHPRLSFLLPLSDTLIAEYTFLRTAIVKNSPLNLGAHPLSDCYVIINCTQSERALSGVPPMRCVRQGEREREARTQAQSTHASSLVRVCVALGRVRSEKCEV